jgi:hypothetical protein
MKRGKPTLDDIRDAIAACEKFYDPLWSKFKQDEQYYELEFKDRLDIPDEFRGEGIVLPTARDMVDAFVDHIDISNARVYVNKKGAYSTSDENAEMMRKFYLGLIHAWNVNNEIMPTRVGAKHYALHGLTVFRTVWDATLWYDEPSMKEGETEEDFKGRSKEWKDKNAMELPIILQALNPMTVMPDTATNGKIYVIEKQERLAFDVFKKWPHWRNDKGRRMDENVTFYSYWDDTYRCDMIDEQPILKVKGGVVKHNYGFIPYVFIDSGLGNISSTNDPVKKYVGMLRYMTDLLVAESRDFSVSDVILKREAWGGGYMTGENAKGVGKIKKAYGIYNPIPEGVEFHEWGRQVPPEALNLHLARTADYIAAHAAPRSVRGLGETGVRSGADRRLVIAEASARYQYSKDAF